MINELKPYNNNQVTNNKPNVPRSFNTLMGHIGGSFNGGIDKTIHFKQCMAGERFKEYRVQWKLKMLTPLTPSYNNLKCCVKTYYVPNKRVWKNAEKYTSQKMNATEVKIEEIPNLGGKIVPNVLDYTSGKQLIALQHTDIWRDCYISSYIPRLGRAEIQTTEGEILTTMVPKISALPLRGRRAIYNDFLRNKKFDEAAQEYDGDEVTKNEWQSYLPWDDSDNITSLTQELIGRAQRPNSYYTDYRTEMQGFETQEGVEILNSETPMNEQLVTWAAWESKIAEARSEAENGGAGLNDWDIIAKIRGSKKLSEGKVQLIGQKTFNLNYAAVTQNAYSNNEDIADVRFKTLGQQGAYSFTEIDMPCFAGYETNEEGYIHVIATVYAESVFCTGIDRLELNVTPLDQYRPDLKDDKLDVLYNIELGTTGGKIFQEDTTTVGFKRRFSEYFKLATCINGDICNQPYMQLGQDGYADKFAGTLLPYDTFQLYEDGAGSTIDPDTGEEIDKDPWKDATDLLINKNLAIKNEIIPSKESRPPFNAYRILGHNQIDYIGIVYCSVDMPIDESVKSNFTNWGEH